MSTCKKMKQKLFLFSLLLAGVSGFAENKKVDLIDPSSIRIIPIAINSPKSDFGASLVGDTLFFASFREDPEKKRFRLKKNQFYDLFFTTIDQQGNPTEARKSINEFSTFFHDGPVAWCNATKELFVTRSSSLDPKLLYADLDNENIKLSISIVKKQGDKWETTEDFPFNNPEYSVGHPAISQSGDTLIFSSDKAGGYGQTDLYMSVRKNGRWSKPVNLGPEINSPGKDEFPFLISNKSGRQYLIFSSDKIGGMGGLDIYSTILNDPGSKVIPFESPINSNYDDFGLTFDLDKRFGYLSSNRPGSGDDDIYKFSFKTPITPQRTLYVFDNRSRKPIKGATLSIDQDISMTTDPDGKIIYLPDDGARSEALASAFGYSEKSIPLPELNDLNNGESIDTVWLDMITNKNIVLNNIYYDFDSWEILSESAHELDKLAALMLENPEMTVELGSHTDSRGTVRYNRKLSQHRAQSAVDYILTKGIDADRIMAIGYGESVLINPCKGRRGCSPAEHRENRRTEIFIPGYGKGSAIVQQKGDYSTESAKKRIKSPILPLANSFADITTSAESPFGYYLILGSFSTKERAESEIQRLNKLSITVTLLSETAPYRIGIGADDLKSAKNLRAQYQPKFPDAWIF